MAVRMFCGQLGDLLVTAHISSRADDVRSSVALMFEPGSPVLVGWTKAKRVGWRVVPVHVTPVPRVTR